MFNWHNGRNIPEYPMLDAQVQQPGILQNFDAAIVINLLCRTPHIHFREDRCFVQA
jgi:hypothetical protein